MGFRVGEFLDVRAACRLEEFRLSLLCDCEPASTGTPHGAIPQTPQTVAAGFWGGADGFGDFHLWYSSQSRGHSASHSNHEAVNVAGALKIKTVTQARTADVRAAKDRDTEHTLSVGAYGANPQTPQPASSDFWGGANGLGTLTPGLRLRAKTIRAH